MSRHDMSEPDLEGVVLVREGVDASRQKSIRVRGPIVADRLFRYATLKDPLELEDRLVGGI